MAPVMTDSGEGPPRLGRRVRAAFDCLRICVFSESSAEAASSRAALPAPLPSSFAARPTRSATSSRTCFRSICFKSSTTRYSFCDLLGGLVLGRLHQVAVTQHADQASVLHDRQPADLLALHLPAGFLDVVVRSNGCDLLAHQVLGGLAA